MQVSSWATILLSMSFEATSLLGVIASISSMKRMHGAELCGRGNITNVYNLERFFVHEYNSKQISDSEEDKYY